MHLGGQKPIVVVVKSVRIRNSDDSKFLLLIADDPMVVLYVSLLFTVLYEFHFISQHHDENDIA